jgi:hypothetical protein
MKLVATLLQGGVSCGVEPDVALGCFYGKGRRCWQLDIDISSSRSSATILAGRPGLTAALVGRRRP